MIVPRQNLVKEARSIWSLKEAFKQNMFCGFLEAYKQFKGLKKNNLRTMITNPLTPPAIKMWCPKSGWKKLDINIYPFIICPSLEACWMSWTLKINIKPSQISGVLQFSSSQRPSPTPETKKISDFFILLPSLGGGGGIIGRGRN